jgi:hypothetical protein
MKTERTVSREFPLPTPTTTTSPERSPIPGTPHNPGPHPVVRRHNEAGLLVGWGPEIPEQSAG